MALQSGFFDAVESDGAYDREYGTEFLTELLKAGFRSGVTPGSFVLSIGTGLTVNVSSGRGFFGGYFFYDTNASTLTCTSATGTRTDLAVIKVNTASRTVTIDVKQNASAAGAGELALAKITVTGSEVTAVENLADGRNYGAKCGSAATVDGHAIFIQQSAPSNPSTGDLWFW